MLLHWQGLTAEGGGWGYSLHSKAREANCLTLEWAHKCILVEVSNAQYHAMWKACLQPRKTILYQAWASHPDLLSSLSTLEHATSCVPLSHDNVPCSPCCSWTGTRWSLRLPPFVLHWVSAALPGGP